MADFSYIGSGKVYLKDTATNENLISVGNASALTMDVQTEEKTLTDYTQAGGGTYNSIEKITGMSANISIHDFSPRNLAIALYGSDSTVTGASITDEVHTNVNAGEFIKTAFPFISAVTVTGTGGTPSYTEGADYEVSDSGINILAGGAIPAGGTIEIDYTYGGSSVVEALLTSGKVFQLVFEGQNEATGKRALVELHRVKFSPTSGLNWIGDDYGVLDLSGKVLQDQSKVGAGISKYMKVSQEA